MNRHFLVVLLLSALSAVGMCSCVAHVDMGSMLDDMGRQSPAHRLQLIQERQSNHQYYEREEIRVWTKDDMYYVQLPIAYMPAQIRNRDYLMGMSMYLSGKVITYPKIIHWDKELIQYQRTKENFYAVLTETQFNKACRGYRQYADWFAHESYPLLASAAMDLTGATIWRPTPTQQDALSTNTHYMIAQLPDRRTTGNQLRRPLALLLDIADIPLSIAATPLVWIADFLHVTLTD